MPPCKKARIHAVDFMNYYNWIYSQIPRQSDFWPTGQFAYHKLFIIQALISFIWNTRGMKRTKKWKFTIIDFGQMMLSWHMAKHVNYWPVQYANSIVSTLMFFVQQKGVNNVKHSSWFKHISIQDWTWEIFGQSQKT